MNVRTIKTKRKRCARELVQSWADWYCLQGDSFYIFHFLFVHTHLFPFSIVKQEFSFFVLILRSIIFWTRAIAIWMQNWRNYRHIINTNWILLQILSMHRSCFFLCLDKICKRIWRVLIVSIIPSIPVCLFNNNKKVRTQ